MMAQSSCATDNVLEHAVESDNLGLVQSLIKPHSSNEDSQTWKRLLRELLPLAKSKEVAELLVKHGADINARGKKGSTVLMEADALPVIKWLIFDKKVYLEETDDKGRTALRRTVQKDKDEGKAKFLIEYTDALINSSDNDGRTVLMTAVWRSRKDVFNLLLSRNVNAKTLDKRKRTVLHHLAGDKEGKRTYDYQPNSTTDNQQFIDRAMLKELLNRGIDPYAKDDKGRTCLHDAASWGCSGLLQVFLQFGRFKDESVKFEPEDDGAWTPLHNACEAESDVLSSVKLLLARKADPNKKTRNGRTPLHLAAGAGNLEIVRHLLSLPEINRNARDMFGNTALLSTANIIDQQKRKDTIKLFAPWQEFHTLTDEAIKAANMSEDTIPAAKLTSKTIQAAKLWNATVVDFDKKQEISNEGKTARNESKEALTERLEKTAGSKKQESGTKQFQHASVFDLLYGRDEKNNDEPAQTVSPSNLKDGGFRWIHLPANNVAWCQDLFTKYFVEDNTMDINSFKALERSFNQQRGGKLPQSRFMSATCQPVLRAWGNEQGGSTVGDRTEGGPSRSNTMISAINEVVHEPEGPERGLNERRPTVEFEGAGRVYSMGSSSDDKEPHPPSSPTRSQFSKPDDAFISDFYAFMPYLHFEIFQKQEEMSEYYKHFAGITNLGECSTPPGSGHDTAPSNERDVALLRAHLNTPDHSLHIRRTLDQSFYHHINTEARDGGQVIHRFQKYILGHNAKTSKILMVDQLWMWILGEKLVVTAFPSRWDQPKNDPLNLLDYVLSIIGLGNRGPIKSVYELAMIISGRCYGAYDRHGVGSEDPQFLDMFEGWISAAMDDEVKLFDFFMQDSASASKWVRNPHSLREVKRREDKARKKRPRKPDRSPDFKVIRMPHKPAYPSTEETFVENLLDIGWETKLVEEVKDIKDELGMLSLIFERQEYVRQGIRDAIESIRTQNKSKPWPSLAQRKFKNACEDHERTISQPAKDIERMKEQAESLYDSVRDLLDLKQKHANAIEARYAREQTDDTSRQGKTLTVFTTVTTIFLPLSFIAAFFAINIRELPHDGKDNQVLSLGYVSKYTFIPGILVASICVGLALYVEHIWYWIRDMYEDPETSMSADEVNTATGDERRNGQAQAVQPTYPAPSGHRSKTRKSKLRWPNRRRRDSENSEKINGNA